MKHALLSCLLALALTPAAVRQTPRALNLTGRWTVQDVEVNVLHERGTVTAVFSPAVACPGGGQLTTFLSSQVVGTSLSGTLTLCRENKKLVTDCPLSSTFSAPITLAAVSEASISVTYRPKNVVFTVRNGRWLNCREQVQDVKDITLTLTRVPCDQAELDAVEKDIDVKTKAVKAYKNALESRKAAQKKTSAALAAADTQGKSCAQFPGRTFDDIQREVIEGLKAQAGRGRGGNRDTGSATSIEESGSVKFAGIEGSGCSLYAGTLTVTDPNACTLNFEAGGCTGGRSYQDEICRRHESGHIEDLQAAWKKVQNGEWDKQRGLEYIANGTEIRPYDGSKCPSDVIASLDSEIREYERDLERLAQLEEALSAACGRH